MLLPRPNANRSHARSWLAWLSLSRSFATPRLGSGWTKLAGSDTSCFLWSVFWHLMLWRLSRSLSRFPFNLLRNRFWYFGSHLTYGWKMQGRLGKQMISDWHVLFGGARGVLFSCMSDCTRRVGIGIPWAFALVRLSKKRSSDVL